MRFPVRRRGNRVRQRECHAKSDVEGEDCHQDGHPMDPCLPLIGRKVAELKRQSPTNGEYGDFGTEMAVPLGRYEAR
jgi:hypothetical protein